jgi:dipeptidyl aminopeptidase/acylaminoacyl peptidase
VRSGYEFRTGCARLLLLLIVVANLITMSAVASGPGATKRAFTPADDVGLAQFPTEEIKGGPIKFSSDGRYFAVITERGLLAENAPEDTIWVFETKAVQEYLQDDQNRNMPAPVPLVRMATAKDAPIIKQMRWLSDSRRIAFLAVKRSDNLEFYQLSVADVTTHSVKTMTPDDQNVDDFDIQGENCVYEVSAPKLRTVVSGQNDQAMTALTGARLYETILSPVHYLPSFDQGGIWVLVKGKRLRVRDGEKHEKWHADSSLSMSPDGHYISMISTEHNPPETWARYKFSPGAAENFQAIEKSQAWPFEVYYLIDLQDGTERRLLNAPVGKTLNWKAQTYAARWSKDGKLLLLPDSFLPLDVTDPNEISAREAQPCITVLRLNGGQPSCVLPLKAGNDKERFKLGDVRFLDDSTVVVNFDRSYFKRGNTSSEVFHLEPDGSWRVIRGSEDPRPAAVPIQVEVREDLTHSPVIVAEDKASRVARTIWDPNPQIKEFDFGEGEGIQWKDKSGYEWEAGLIKPPGYIKGRRYPLVIQTHGFDKNRFLSNGLFSTAFAARALSSSGIVVVQMGWNPNHFDTPQEIPDQIAGFESLVAKLTREELIDSSRVGVIGFSRCVFHVLATLTSGSRMFAAASVTDGITDGYFEYILRVDELVLGFEFDKLNEGNPYEEVGLKNWIARSPGFNLNKVQAPLLLVEPGLRSVLENWEPYAGLRYLKKPVDLIMLEPGTHVMTNPRQRVQSETLNVDWFRFWLKCEEDPDPAKAEQYVRWRELRKLQEENDRKIAKSQEKAN